MWLHQGGMGKQRTELPHRLNNLPHRPLVLYSNLPNDNGHFDEVVWATAQEKS